MEKRHLVYGAFIVVAAMIVYWMLNNERSETQEENIPQSDEQITEAGSHYTANVPYRNITSAPSPDQSSVSIGQFLTYPNFDPAQETENILQIGLPESAYIN